MAQINRFPLREAFILNDIFSISNGKDIFNTAEVNLSFSEGKNALEYMYVSNIQSD